MANHQVMDKNSKQLRMHMEEEVYSKLHKIITNLSRFAKIKIEVIRYETESKVIFLSVQQIEKMTDEIYSFKDMHDLLRSFVKDIDSYGWKIQIRPKEYESDEIGDISASWVKNKMEENNISKRSLSKTLGVDEFIMSKLLNNKLGFTRWHKAAFFFYFKSTADNDRFVDW
jgi:hypothetical protein